MKKYAISPGKESRRLSIDNFGIASYALTKSFELHVTGCIVLSS